MTNILVLNNSETCHACQDLIKSETILAGPHTYHQECFTCAHCSKALGDNFYSVDNKNYCEEHKEVDTSPVISHRYPPSDRPQQVLRVPAGHQRGRSAGGGGALPPGLLQMFQVSSCAGQQLLCRTGWQVRLSDRLLGGWSPS